MELQPGQVGEGQRELGELAPEQHRRAGHGVGDQHRGEVRVIVAPALPERLAQDAPSASTSRMSSTRARRRPSALRSVASLSGYQRSSWSESATSSALGGHHAQRALEVAVEARPLRGARDREARVAAEHGLHRGDALRARGIVADQADPAPVGLRAQGLDLAPETVPCRARRWPCRPRSGRRRPAPDWPEGRVAAARSTSVRPAGTVSSRPSARRTASSTGSSPGGRAGSGTVAQNPLW